MSALPVRRSSRRIGRAQAAALVGVFAALALSGPFVHAAAETSLVVLTGVGALAGGIALSVYGIRTRTLTSPLMLLGIPLTLSLAAATLSSTQIYTEWKPSTLWVAIGIAVAPIAGAAGAMLLTDGRAVAPKPGTSAPPHADRFVAVCWLMVVVGTIVYLIEYATIGGPPILQSSVDEARFALDVGPLHVFTQGIPLAFLIAAWGRVARPHSFSWLQRRSLEALLVVAPCVLMLTGGRSLVLIPLVSALVVIARYLRPVTSRRLLIVVPIAVIVFSSAVFVTRAEQHAPTGPFRAVLYDSGTGQRSAPWKSAYRSLALGLGEQVRVVQELRVRNVESPPFSTTLWFAHPFTTRAVDPHDITGRLTGGWLTSTYAGQVLLDFGLAAALLFGVALGAAAHLLYRRFAEGRSIAVIWVYAYLAGPIFMAFYLNVFLYFLFPVVDIVGLVALSRLLMKAPVPASAA